MQAINKDNFTLREIIRIENTPKKYVIIARGKVYCTNDLQRTLNSFVIKDFPNIKENELTIIKK